MEADESNGTPLKIGLYHKSIMLMVTIVVFGFVIFFGALFNIAAMIILIRRRMWRQHDGYLYILAIFVANCAIISFTMLPHFVYLFPSRFQLEASSDFACKMYNFVLSVANCVGWIVVALLINVCLSGYVKHQGIKNVYCRKFANRYCTAIGSVVTVAIIAVCFALMDIWTLWAYKVVSFEGVKSSKGYLSICDIANEWFHVIPEWQIPSIWIKLFVPVAIFIPVTWILTYWFQRKHNAGFSVSVLNQVDHNIERREAARVALIVGAAIFLLQLPRVVTGILIFSHYQIQVYVVHRVVFLLFDTHVVFVPLCCLIAIAQMRKDLISAFRSRCCPAGVGSNSADDALSEVNAILALNSNQNPPVEMINND